MKLLLYLYYCLATFHTQSDNVVLLYLMTVNVLFYCPLLKVNDTKQTTLLIPESNTNLRSVSGADNCVNSCEMNCHSHHYLVYFIISTYL